MFQKSLILLLAFQLNLTQGEKCLFSRGISTQNNTLPSLLAEKHESFGKCEHHLSNSMFYVFSHLQIVCTLRVGGQTLPTSFVAFRISSWWVNLLFTSDLFYVLTLAEVDHQYPPHPRHTHTHMSHDESTNRSFSRERRLQKTCGLQRHVQHNLEMQAQSRRFLWHCGITMRDEYKSECNTIWNQFISRGLLFQGVRWKNKNPSEDQAWILTTFVIHWQLNNACNGNKDVCRCT